VCEGPIGPHDAPLKVGYEKGLARAIEQSREMVVGLVVPQAGLIVLLASHRQRDFPWVDRAALRRFSNRRENEGPVSEATITPNKLLYGVPKH
jgi:hypothetical protein